MVKISRKQKQTDFDTKYARIKALKRIGTERSALL
jgi:hypothetical protein